MAGRISHVSEIIDRAHDARPEQLGPKSIHDHARSQRLIGPHEPVCEPKPIARLPARQLRQTRWHGCPDLLARSVEAPAPKHESDGRIWLLPRNERGRAWR